MLWSCTGRSPGNAGPEGGAGADGGFVERQDEFSDGGSTESAAQDAGTYRVLRLQNSICFPDSLPVAGGLALCRVLLADVDGGCASPGLSAATPADIAAVNSLREGAAGPPLSGALCVLAQLPPGQAQTGWCQYETTPGWCYVAGSCEPEAGCVQDICATLGLSAESLDYDQVWLACP